MLIFIIIAALLLSKKRNDGVLGCGIIAFAPNKKNMANLDWIKLIFLANTRRGTDSCGIWINDELTKGVTSEADALNFMAKNPIVYEPRHKNRSIIAHCRAATHGSRIEKNAHPFAFTYEGRTIVLAHNGTISNYRELAREYEVDIDNLDVDSQVMAKIILERGFDVLGKYKGTGAFIWAYEDEPNTLYAFKGASKDKRWDTTDSIERPLFMIKNSDGCYISSMYEPLDAICNQDIECKTFVSNSVIRIRDNSSEVLREIDRSEANLSVFQKTEAATTAREDRAKLGASLATRSSSSENKNWKGCVSVPQGEFIYREMTYSNSNYGSFMRGGVYYLAGRYYSIPGGVVSYNEFKDTPFPGANTPSMEKYLLHGEVSIIDFSSEFYATMPYVQDTEHVSGSVVFKRLFYKGVLIDDSRRHRWIEKKMEKRLDGMTNPFEKLKQLSAYSRYPITLLHSDSLLIKKENKGVYYAGGNIIKSIVNFIPVHSNRMYEFGPRGTIIKIYSLIDKDRIIDTISGTLVDATGQIIVIPKDEEKIFLKGEEESLFRYRGANELEEKNLKLYEKLDGVADTYYFLASDENVSIHGADIKKSAIELILEDVMVGVQPEEWLHEKVEELFEQGSNHNEGLLKFMELTFAQMDFAVYLEMAVHNEIKEITEEYYGNPNEGV